MQPFKLLLLVVSLAICASYLIHEVAAEDDSNVIKVGILHSLTGTISASEIPLRWTIEWLINKTNAQGGVLGKKLVPVVVNPASNWPLFAELARQLITQDKVAVVFGCWTSVSRKSVLSVFEELNHLLFYPVQYEGEECSKNVFYTGAAPNQQAIPAVDYLYNNDGRRRFVLCGTDYVYPRTTNTILLQYLQNSLGISSSDILTIYTPFGHSDWSALVDTIVAFADEGALQGKPTAVVSTLNGDVNDFFYGEIARKGISATEIPIVAFSVGEQELQGRPLASLSGHLAAWNYFMSVNNSINNEFISQYQSFMNDNTLLTNDPMEAHYIGFKMWVAAVLQAGTTNIDAVRQAVYGQTVASPSGYTVRMNTNHHLSKPVMIGKIQTNGQFDIIYQTAQTVDAVPWSPYTNLDLPKCDWSWPWVCGRCVNGTYVNRV